MTFSSFSWFIFFILKEELVWIFFSLVVVAPLGQVSCLQRKLGDFGALQLYYKVNIYGRLWAK